MDQNHLLDDLQASLVQASHGKRILNLIIDTLIFYGVIIVLVFPIVMVSPESFDEDPYASNPGMDLMWNVISLVIYLMYYSSLEYLSGGRTLGKLITGTLAIMDDGSKMSFSTTFKRNAIRLIPFEIFSCFGSPCYPWHDKWTNTYVIDLKQSQL
jgi:uncharacterized RDD family membrane protein YckC